MKHHKFGRPVQVHPVWVSWLDYPKLLRDVHWKPRQDGPGMLYYIYYMLCFIYIYILDVLKPRYNNNDT